MIKEEISILLNRLLENKDVFGYAVVKSEGVVVHSEFKQGSKRFKETLPQLSKIFSTITSIGHIFGDKTANYSLLDMKGFIILIIPVYDKGFVATVLSKECNVNVPYKQIIGLREKIAVLLEV